jgi:PadR family transcriptional regulator, regulatory protein AphA
MLKYILLGNLNHEPLTGYQIKQWVDQTTRHFWHAHTSQVYRTLGKLEDDDLARSEIQEQESRPDRRLYHITQTGRDVLRKWLAQPITKIEPTKDKLIARLFFSAQLDKDTILTQLRLQRDLHQQQLDLLREEIVQQINAGKAAHPNLVLDALMWDIARRNGELMEEAYISWLDETIARVEAEFDANPTEENNL